MEAAPLIGDMRDMRQGCLAWKVSVGRLRVRSSHRSYGLEC